MPTEITTILIDNGVARQLSEMKKKLASSAVSAGKSAISITGTFSQNLFQAIGMMGLTGLVSAGGMIASLVLMRNALSKFAEKGLGIRATAERLNLTIAEFKQLTNIGIAQGLSPEESGEEIGNMARAVLDLRRGVDSETRQALEQQLGPMGTIVSREFQAKLEAAGDRTFDIMKEVLTEIARLSRGTDQERLAAEAWRKAFGLRSPVMNQAIEAIDELGSNSLGPVEEDALEFMRAQAETQREWNNFTTEIGVGLIPVITDLNKLLAEWISPENTQAFIDTVKKWLEAAKTGNWPEIRSTIDRFMADLITGTGKFAEDCARLYRALMGIKATMAKWHRMTTGHKSQTTGNVPVPYVTSNPSGISTDAGWVGTVVAPSPTVAPAQQPIIWPPPPPVDFMKDFEYLRAPPPDFMKDFEHLRGGAAPLPFLSSPDDLATERASWDIGGLLAFAGRGELDRFERQLRELHEELKELYSRVDINKMKLDISGRGSFPGGSDEGGVARTGRTRPMATPAGGRGVPAVRPAARPATPPVAKPAAVAPAAPASAVPPAPATPTGPGAASVAPEAAPAGGAPAAPAAVIPEEDRPLRPRGAPPLVRTDSSGIVDVSPETGLRVGQPRTPTGLLVHHTSAREKDAAQVGRALGTRGLSVDYVIDREANITRISPEGRESYHAGKLEKMPGEGNMTLEGVEVIAKDEKDVLDSQREAIARLAALRGAAHGWDPRERTLGHGEGTRRKESDEGATAGMIRRGEIALPEIDPVTKREKYIPPTADDLEKPRAAVDGALNGLKAPEEPDTKLDLDVKVRGRSGIGVWPRTLHGDLMEDDRTKVTREIVPAAAP